MKALRFFILVTVIVFAGCTGPQGPAGQNGVANITVSVVGVSLSAWTSNVTYYEASTNAITIEQVNNDVAVSFSTSSIGPWQGMPLSNVFISGDQLAYSWTTNNIAFFYDYTSLSNMPNTIYFNVSVIPLAIIKKYPNVNFKDANQVMQLPEWKAAMKVAKYVTTSVANTGTSVKN
jgi:hypothetical protein